MNSALNELSVSDHTHLSVGDHTHTHTLVGW